MASAAFSKISAKIVGRWESAKWKASNKLLWRYRRRNLTNHNFSIISNNCAGEAIYQKLAMRYTTPTIGLFLFSDDYIKFLEEFEYYIKQPLQFKVASKHPVANESITKSRHSYPIGVLGDDIEVHFLHYKNENNAKEKWGRRTDRINLQNLFFIYGDKENFKEEFLYRYEKLSFEHKLFLSSKHRESAGKAVIVRISKNDPMAIAHGDFWKDFDIVKWLNGEKT